MKRFAYGCLGILALTIAFHFGASSGRASSGPQFALLGDEIGQPLYVTEEGNIWTWNESDGWIRLRCTIGMPLENIAAYQGRYLVDLNGQMWRVGSQHLGTPEA